MIYEQLWDERQRLCELHAVMTQPLDVAVLAVQTRLPRPAPHADLVLRTNYLSRVHADERLTQPLLEPACMDRGS